jgi:polyphosphate kinase
VRQKLSLVNREISWLSFNERVLQEAENNNNPLIERIKFLGIFSNNRDEFFRVRVATLRRLMLLKPINNTDISPKKLFEKVMGIVNTQQERFEIIYTNLFTELKKNKIQLLSHDTSITLDLKDFLKTYFEQKVENHIVPIILDRKIPFPFLKDKMLYLAISFITKDKITKYALIEVPTDKVSRFVILPATKQYSNIMLLEDLIKMNIDKIFKIFEITEHQSYTIKMTRDSELDMDDDLNFSDLEKVEHSLKKRKTGVPVRLVYDANIDKKLLNFIFKNIEVLKKDNLVAEGKYQNMKDFLMFPNNEYQHLRFEKANPIPHPFLQQHNSYLDAIAKKDVMVHFPYHSFDHVIEFLREAAIDPKVQSIKITLYRVSSNSRIVNALINAVKNGKEVTVAIELKARFDEQNNIEVARKLKDEGAKIVFGVSELKNHSKLLLVDRINNRKKTSYLYYSTGNFNEDTATIYTDIGIFTSNEILCKDAENLFEFIEKPYKQKEYKAMFVSPTSMRKSLSKLITNEIARQHKFNDGRIWIKVNNMMDTAICKLLHKAVEAGVDVKLITRSTCALYMEEAYPNLEILSIVGRYLEHARIIIVGKNKQKKVFLTSADSMTRNIDYRIETCVPVLDKVIALQIEELFTIQLNDNVTARCIDKAQQNLYKENNQTEKINAQIETFKYIRSIK